MAKHAASRLTARQEEFVQAVVTGAPTSGISNSSAMTAIPKVKAEIAAARLELSDATKLTRLDVIEGVLDGIQVARMQADGGNVIRGWTEIAKILGHYAPEVKTLNLNINQQRLRSKFEELSDEELMGIVEGNAIEVRQ